MRTPHTVAVIHSLWSQVLQVNSTGCWPAPFSSDTPFHMISMTALVSASYQARSLHSVCGSVLSMPILVRPSPCPSDPRFFLPHKDPFGIQPSGILCLVSLSTQALDMTSLGAHSELLSGILPGINLSGVRLHCTSLQLRY